MRWRVARSRPALLVAVAALIGLPTVAALGFWTSPALLSGPGAGAAGSVNAGETPSVSRVGPSSVLISWAPSAMSNASAVDGYRVQRYDATTDAAAAVLASCGGAITATSCTETGVPAGRWSYAVTATIGVNWRGGESAKSAAIELQPPVQTISLTSSVKAFMSDTTLYYKGDGPGSFKLLDTVSGTSSGPASATFPAISTSGWSHGAETVTTPAGGPYGSASFAWTASPANPSGYAVTAADNAGNTGSAPVSFVSDTTAPTGGSISYPSGVIKTLSVPVSVTAGTDSQSGVDAGSAAIWRAEATQNTMTRACGTFGGFTTAVTLAGGADTSVTSGHCYSYEYLISDHVGNQATHTSAGIAKVDAIGPLGSAAAFAVLGATTVTSTGLTTINGDLGISPGTACTGLSSAPCTAGPGTVNGTVHSNDATAASAQADLATGYNSATGATATTIPTTLGGAVVTPGVYDSPSGTWAITGTLTLDAQGDPDAVFIFKAATTLNTTGGNSNVALANGARSCNVFWQIGSSATMGAATTFRGNLLAFTTITAGAGASFDGSLLAHGAAVTLDSNTVTRANCA